jgi:hypothetical protein
MPPACAIWNCPWLVNDDTADLPRPDRARYVIDLMSDNVTLRNDQTGENQHIQVVQIWIDPTAHRDPAFRRYVERRAEQGIAAIIRFDQRKSLVLFAPVFADDGQWHYTGIMEQEHTLDQVVRALGVPPTMVISDV